jgi:hypothetical protein
VSGCVLFLGQAADQLDEFLDGPAGRGPYRLLGAVRLQRCLVQQVHQPRDVLHGPAFGCRADRLVGAVGIARRPGQQGHQTRHVLHGPVHADRPQGVDGGLRVLR